MDEEGFTTFLKKGGRSQRALNRIVNHVKMYEQYLHEEKGTILDEACVEDLEAFVECMKKGNKSTKTVLWALCYYFEFSSNEDLRSLASTLRGEQIKRKPFSLKEFQGVNGEHVKKLAINGIKNVEHLLEKGKTQKDRETLSEETGIPVEGILELVKLSDLSRIPGVKGIRARLYYDAGVDTLEKLAQWNPEELRNMLTTFVEQTGFDGIAPLPKEVDSTVKTAKTLPKIVEY